MRKYTFGALASVALAMTCGVACSSGSTAANDTGDAATCNPCGDDGGGLTVGAGNDSNPDGVPYPAPAGGYGRTARTREHARERHPELQVPGLPDADRRRPYPSSLSTISLADYYDPCNKRYKMIHLSVAAVWCVPCNEETAALVAANSQLVSRGHRRPPGARRRADGGHGATPADLNNWIRTTTSNFTEMLDPNLQNLGGFFNAAAIPWNADLDPRTMEILDSSEGWSGNVSSGDLALGSAVAAELPGSGLAPRCQ